MASSSNIQSVLDRIATVVSVSGRKIADNQDVDNAVRELNACKQNLQRISSYISTDIFQTINSAINDMLQLSGQADHMSSNLGIPLSPSANATVQHGLRLLSFSFYLC